MNKKILLRSVSLFFSLALLAGATFAFFSDEGTSNDNVFAAGTLDMLLSDDNETDQDDVSGTWGLESAPGDIFSDDLLIKNSGDVDADHIELQFENAVTEATSGPGTDATTPMDTVIEITALDWDSDGDAATDTDLLALVTDLNGNGIIDLDDLENTDVDPPIDFDDVAFGGTQGADHTLHMEGELDGDLATNEHQGDEVSMDLTVTMNQDASQ
jgi:predicted ribosomally synthesized peptide with SipW-like signal peptide